MNDFASPEDMLRYYGIDPSEFKGSMLDDKFRKMLHYKAVRGVFKVDDADLQANEFNTPYSSNVEWLRYDPAQDSLYVGFNNRREKAGTRVYHYTSVSDWFDNIDLLFEELTSSPSPGSVVWNLLRKPGRAFTRL